MADATEQKILNAANQVFLEKGFSDTRMEDIADLAGINKALLHYYFRSKSKLFNLIAKKTFSSLVPTVNAAIEIKGNSLDILDGVITAYVAHIAANPHLPLFVLNELSHNRISFLDEIKAEAGHMPNIPLLLQQIFSDIEDGVIRPINPVHLILNVMSMTIFPFLARPVVTKVMSLSDEEYQSIIAERTKEVQEFVRQSLRP